MKIVLLFALVLCVSPAFAGLVTNGTFDGNCAGWTLASTDSLTCSATEGNPTFALILNNGPGPVPQASQSIAGLVLGDTYLITLEAKTHYNCCNSTLVPGAGVGIDGQQFDFFILNNQPWTPYQFSFTYGGGSTTLVLSAQRNGTDSDGQFDNVDINLSKSGAIPEPSTLSILGIGLAGLLALGRRRTSR